MSISPRTKFILWTRSGSRCAFPDCRCKLYHEAVDDDPDVLLGEMAHIVGQGDDGPRHDKTIPGGKVDGYENLVLLCTKHHTIIDRQIKKYSVDKLVQIKSDHERWVDASLSYEDRFRTLHEPCETTTESVASTLLAVERMPRVVYSAPCTSAERTVAKNMGRPPKSNVMLPFIIRSKRLFTFFDLSRADSPFDEFVDLNGLEEADAFKTWWPDPDKLRWYSDLLNRSLNKLTGRHGLMLDKRHKRYYFPPEDVNQERKVVYFTMSGRKSNLSVAREPITRKTGKGKGYWEHLAVGLKFERVDTTSWCLSIRPERRFTKDGSKPLSPKRTTRKATSRKSRMYNVNVHKEVHFWRDFLSDGSPRIIFDFGNQSIVIPTGLIQPTIEWPGVFDDMPKVESIEYEDDLFSSSAYSQILDYERVVLKDDE